MLGSSGSDIGVDLPGRERQKIVLTAIARVRRNLFDIATGHFEIGALLALEGKWQKLEKIRILMGAETTQRTRKALLEAVWKRSVEALNASIEDNKDGNPFKRLLCNAYSECSIENGCL
jgi:hypothetical protein